MNNSSAGQVSPHLLEQYRQFQFLSAVCLTVLSPITVTANVLLLTVVWKDPLNCFRTPTTYFTIGLALADLICGMTVEPIFALYYYAKHFKVQEPKLLGIINTLFKVGGGISTVTVSTSYLLVLGLSASQLVAVRYPHHYKIIVTKPKVLAYVVCSWIYFILFTTLQLTGIDLTFLLKVNVALHPTLISVILVIVHFFLYRSLKKQALKRKTRETSFIETSADASPNVRHLKWSEGRGRKRTMTLDLGRKAYFEKQIIVLAVHLASILLVSSCFHVVSLNILLYKKATSFREEVYINIAVRASDLMLFVKIALDAFVYAWRLPTYRKAFLLTLRSCSVQSIITVWMKHSSLLILYSCSQSQPLFHRNKFYKKTEAQMFQNWEQVKKRSISRAGSYTNACTSSSIFASSTNYCYLIYFVIHSVLGVCEY